MPSPRLTTFNDKSQLRELWKVCFGDSDDFLDFFFNKRFSPDFSVCIEENGVIANAMYSYPFHMNIRGKIIPVAILAGFSTNPNFRGRGYMKKSFNFLINALHSYGVAIAPHTPVIHESYFNIYNFTATKSRFLECPATVFSPQASDIKNISIASEASSIYICYDLFAQHYSGILKRTLSDFILKFTDYLADGGKCIALLENNKAKAYAVYYDSDTEITAVEVISLSPEYEQRIIFALYSLCDNKKLTIKLPPNSDSILPNSSYKTIPHGVAAIVNVSKLLSATYCGYDSSFKVNDPIIPENNGIFNTKGEISNSSPCIEINAGRLLQFLEGYCSIAELISENNAIVLDNESISQLDYNYPKQQCYIIDEY